MKFAVIGCGYIAESYASALPHHRELHLMGAWDSDKDKLAAFAARWGCRRYTSEADLLADPAVELVLNLTNPRSHAKITHAALVAGKHVYSEKPLGMTEQEAGELVEIARSRGLMLASAPCSMLSETAQTVSDALRAGMIGKVRLIYANFDDGMIAPRLAPWNWRNAAGAAWPAKDEFEVGCTYEHAGYLLTWLAAFFGPARRVTAFAACLLPDKGIVVDCMAPDFMTGCIEYDEKVTARITCSLVAPEDKSLTIIGDKGVLRVDNVRHERCPVRYRAYQLNRLSAGVERRINSLRHFVGMPSLEEGWTGWRALPYVKPPPRWLSGRKAVDFLRGPSEMEAARAEGRACRQSAELGQHITEIINALQHPMDGGARIITSTFPEIQPMYSRDQTQTRRP
jgi:predicted dehydrogenase